MVARPHVTCSVRTEDGAQEEEIIFDDRPLQLSVRNICKEFKLQYDEEDNFHVLVAGTEPTAPVITSWGQLEEAEKARTVLVLMSGSRLVEQRLGALQEVEGDTSEQLWGVLECVRGDAWLAEEAVQIDGIKHVIKVVTDNAKPPTEIAMVCLNEIFRTGNSTAWLEENTEEIGPTFFRKLFVELFPPANQADAGKDRPHASLAACLFLLQRLPECARSAHAAAIGAQRWGEGKGTAYEALYPHILDSLDSDEEFQRNMAEAVLSAMAATAVEDKELRIFMRRELLSETEGDILKRFETPGQLAEPLLTASMAACVDLAVAHSRATEQSKALATLRKLEGKIEHMHEVSEKMKAEMRKQHQIMCKMAPFVRIETDPVVEQSLEGIIRYGWDSLNWKRGYNLMHYVAESVADPKVVELIGLLSSDIDKRDDGGMRPIDYARQVEDPENIQVIEKLRGRRKAVAINMQSKDVGTDAAPDSQLWDQLNAIREELPPKLIEVIERVLQSGWAHITWPSNFTAVHLAARCGHVGALELLSAAGADLNTPDDWKLTPLDYAAQESHDEAILAIQRLIEASAQQPKPAFTPAQIPTPKSVVVTRQADDRANSGASLGSLSDFGVTLTENMRRSSLEDEVKVTPTTPSQARRSLQKLDEGPIEEEVPKLDASPVKKNALGLVTRSRSCYVEPTSAERKQLKVPDGLHPELVRACSVVLAKGWGKVKWPKGFTALHLAAQLGSAEVVQFLLDATASPSLEERDSNDFRPLDYAVNMGHTQVEQLLRASDETPEEALQPERTTSMDRLPDEQRLSMRASISSDVKFALQHRAWEKVRSQIKNNSKVRQALTGISELSLPSVSEQDGPDEELGAEDLRVEVHRLKLEKLALQEKNEKLRTGSAEGIVQLDSPLNEHQLKKYLVQFEAFGKEAVADKLMSAAMTGGLALDETDTKRALNQLEFVIRLIQQDRSATPADVTSDKIDVGANKKDPSLLPVSPGKDPPISSKSGTITAEGANVETELKLPDEPGKAKGPTSGKGKGPKGPGPAKPPPPMVVPTGKGPPGKVSTPKTGVGKTLAVEPKAKAGPGKGGKAKTFNKPPMKPAKLMKPLWWTAYVFGQHLQPGETVWDDVQDDIGLLDLVLLEERFAKNAPPPRERKPKEDSNKKAEVKILQIIKDPNVVIQKETSLRKLPPAQECARALEDLDDAVLDIHMVQIIKDAACPTPAERKQLEEEKAKQPHIPMALPEQYMWVIGNLKAYQQRVQCWYFIRTYQERMVDYHRALTDFMECIECFKESEMLSSLLGIILAVGNYLNGGTSRGQADGFDLETLQKLESIKDFAGKDVRSFIFDVYFHKLYDKAAVLVEELEPLMRNVSRRLSKESDSTEKLNKQARVNIEEFDTCVKSLSEEFDKMNETMTMILQYFEDPADQFKLRMPGEYEKAKQGISALVTLKEKARNTYAEVLTWFKVNAMKSKDFFLLWDNFFVPGDLIVNKDAQMKQNYLVPTFCQGRPPSVEDLMVLWEFKAPDDVKRTEKKRRKRDPEARKRRQERREKDNAERKDKEGATSSVGGGFDDSSSALPKAGGPGGKGIKGKGKPGKGTAMGKADT